MKDALTAAAYNYIATLDRIGSPKDAYPPDTIASLCAEGCRKVRNGKVLFEGVPHFAEQLVAGKEWLGAWSIAVQEVLTIAEERTAIIRYHLATALEGDLAIIVILRFDERYLIQEINEVHNRLER